MRPRGGYVHPLKLLRKLWGIMLVGRLLGPQWSRRELPLLLLELVRKDGGTGVLVSLLPLGRELRVGLVLGLTLGVVIVWAGGGEGEHVECGFPGPGWVHGRQLLLLRLGRVINQTGLQMSDIRASFAVEGRFGAGCLLHSPVSLSTLTDAIPPQSVVVMVKGVGHASHFVGAKTMARGAVWVGVHGGEELGAVCA
jgi:hypothetical protein